MMIFYDSLDDLFRENPVRVADWGYIQCTEADLSGLGIKFFDDIEDPGPCRRSAFRGRGGAIIILTIYVNQKGRAVVFSSNHTIMNGEDFVGGFPLECSGIPEKFDVVYFGFPA